MDVSFEQTAHDLWRILAQGGWVMAAIFAAGQAGWFLVVERWWHYRALDGKPDAFWKTAPADPAALAERLAPSLEAARGRAPGADAHPSAAPAAADSTGGTDRGGAPRGKKTLPPRRRKAPKGLWGSVAAAVVEARHRGREAMVEGARTALRKDTPGLSRHLNTIAVLATAAPLLGLAGTVAGIMETFDVITLYGAGNPSMMAGGIAQALMVTEAGLVVAFPLLICHDQLRKRADHIEDSAVAGATRLIRLYSGGGGFSGEAPAPKAGGAEGAIA